MSSNAQETKPYEVPPTLPDPALPDADWADAFEITTHNAERTMIQIAKFTIGTLPNWARQLMRLRNVIVAPFGLKTDDTNDVSLTTDTVGIFPVLDAGPDRLVLGFDDKHLDFRLVLGREHDGQTQRIRATTLVKRHNMLGKAYISLITPFHRAIVAASLKPLGR